MGESCVIYYLDLQRKYEQKFKRAIVLFQMGKFYEMFEYNPVNCRLPEHRISKHRPGVIYDEPIGKATEVAHILDGMAIGRHVSDSDIPYCVDWPEKAGFPTTKYDSKCRTILIHGFVVIRVDQIMASQVSHYPPNELFYVNAKSEARRIAEIVSQTTAIDMDLPPVPTNAIVSIYIEYPRCKSFDESIMCCGVSSIDVVTGQSIISEILVREGNLQSTVQDLIRFLLAQQPREIIINVTHLSDELQTAYSQYLLKTLELDRMVNYIINYDQVNAEYFKLPYQAKFFNKIFFQKDDEFDGDILYSSSAIVEKLGLDRMEDGRLSYVLLLQHCYEYSPLLIHKVKLPNTTWIDSKRHMILANNAARQLDILPEVMHRSRTRCHSLFDVLNKTRTRLGYRKLRERVLNPLVNIDELNRSYQRIADLTPELTVQLGGKLKSIPDLDRYHRKIMQHKLSPTEFSTLYSAYTRATELYALISQSNSLELKNLLMKHTDGFNRFMTIAHQMFDFERLRECKIRTEEAKSILDFVEPPIRPGAVPELDEIINQLNQRQAILQAICDHLNQFLTRNRGAKLEWVRRDVKKERIIGYDIITTQAKAKALEQQRHLINTDLCGYLEFEVNHSQRRITSTRIRTLMSELESLKLSLRVSMLTIYQNFIHKLSEYDFYTELSEMIAMIDFTYSARIVADEYHYHRPIPMKSDQSFLEIDDLRHPVIERVIDQPYVTNTVNLHQIRGLLVYGANSTGKSSLARAIALNIIMAQAGLYTAGKLKFSPFYRVFTRITGDDDIIGGKSSFVVEMSEISIFHRDADDKSLVLGDEPCRGTERFSGVAIALEVIRELVNRKSCFIFATHLHDMLSLSIFRSIREKLQIVHLGLHYDEETKKVIIDRKLQLGSGPTIYGIEVARSLGFSSEFIRRATEIRAEASKISTELMSSRKSRYNSKVYMDECLLCGSQENLHTHHLIPQRHANGKWIDDMPKDIAGNLVVLCRDCHVKIHSGTAKIDRDEIPGGVLIKTEIS